MIKTKVILTGSFGVGKTSLFNRFLYKRFSESYLTTIGVKIDKKTVELDEETVEMALWDIAGEVTQDKIPVSYFWGAHAIIYVLDLTRPLTYSNIVTDLEYLKKNVPKAIIKVVGNKIDLVDESRMLTVENEIPVTLDIKTSAKTGENVEELFQALSKGLLSKV